MSYLPRSVYRIAVLAVLLTMIPCGARADDPRLSETQIQVIQAVRHRTEKKAVPLALQLASTAQQVYDNMLADKEDRALRRKLSREMDRIVVALLEIKGQSIREMVAVLTPDQKRLVHSEMRKPGAPGDLSELIDRIFKLSEKK